MVSSASSPTRCVDTSRRARASASPRASGPHQASPSPPSRRGASASTMRSTRPARATPSPAGRRPRAAPRDIRPRPAAARRPPATRGRRGAAAATPGRRAAQAPRTRRLIGRGPHATTVPRASRRPNSAQRERQPQLRVAHDAQRLASRVDATRREPRIVRARGARADHDRVGGRAQAMAERSRLGPGDPARAPARVGDAAVERGGDLPRHARTARGVRELSKPPSCSPGLVGAQPERDVDSRAPQRAEAAAVHNRVRIAARDDAAPDAAAMMASTHGGVRPTCTHGSSVT